MNAAPADSLAKELLEGTYAPARLDDCRSDLPLDRNPHVVRFTQFFLVQNPALDPKSSKEPEYLILQPHRLAADAPGSDKTVIDHVVNPMARAIGDDLLKGNSPQAADGRDFEPLPDP